MSTPDEQVQAVKTRLANASRTRLGTELRRDQATARAQTILDQLKADFGVATVQEARTLLRQLQTDLNERLAELSAALDAADA